jgi:hypothetical protein
LGSRAEVVSVRFFSKPPAVEEKSHAFMVEGMLGLEIAAFGTNAIREMITSVASEDDFIETLDFNDKMARSRTG